MRASLFHLLPHHLISALTGILGRSTNAWVRRTLIKKFMRMYDVDLSDAIRKDIEEYVSFEDFFTRELNASARPVDSYDESIVSPVDGTISQAGRIDDGLLVQAKGMQYTVDQLLDEQYPCLDNGYFATLYLAPRDYHRIHAPATGSIDAVTAIPGRLFSVNEFSANHIANLFGRNERLVCWMCTARGPLVCVFVGAMIVSSIETVWSQRSKSPYRSRIREQLTDVHVDRGQEIARFSLGSTVILLVPADVGKLSELKPGDILRMGQAIGAMHDPTETT